MFALRIDVWLCIEREATTKACVSCATIFCICIIVNNYKRVVWRLANCACDHPAPNGLPTLPPPNPLLSNLRPLTHTHTLQLLPHYCCVQCNCCPNTRSYNPSPPMCWHWHPPAAQLIPTSTWTAQPYNRLLLQGSNWKPNQHLLSELDRNIMSSGFSNNVATHQRVCLHVVHTHPVPEPWPLISATLCS